MKKPRVLIQSFKDQARAAMRALAYLKVQRKRLTGNHISRGKDKKSSGQGPSLASQATIIPAGDLESVLGSSGLHRGESGLRSVEVLQMVFSSSSMVGTHLTVPVLR